MTGFLRRAAQTKAKTNRNCASRSVSGGAPPAPALRPVAPTPEQQAETARYIAQITAELCHMAGAAQLETLGYFLSMAQLEAAMAASQTLLREARFREPG